MKLEDLITALDGFVDTYGQDTIFISNNGELRVVKEVKIVHSVLVIELQSNRRK